VDSRLQHSFRDPGFAKAFELSGAGEFFDAKIGRIRRMRIDQNRGNPGATEHCGGGRAGKAAADDRNVGVFHGLSRLSGTISAPGKANKPLPLTPDLARRERGWLNNARIKLGTFRR
jgi:hypothetical protein